MTLALLTAEPFTLSDTDCIQQLLSYLWKQENRLSCIDILAPLLIGSEKTLRWFIDEQGLSTVFKNIDALIANEGGHADLTSYLLFLSDLCHSTKWK